MARKGNSTQSSAPGTTQAPNPAAVPEPILNSPFEEPSEHWYIEEHAEPVRRTGRRPPLVYPPRVQRSEWELRDGTMRKSQDFIGAYELVLVNLIRQRVKSWREQGYPGVTRTTFELLHYWRRDGRSARLFYAQLEAVETIIFLTEARSDFLQGVNVPWDHPTDTDVKAFRRYASKIATGGGKSTVAAMVIAWSILNKVTNSGDARFSDVVLMVCPNVTIRSRLNELRPENGEDSVYRKRDLVPPSAMDTLRQGRIIITNWHVFEPQQQTSGGVSARVMKLGKPVRIKELLHIGPKTNTARGKRYISLEDLDRQVSAGMLAVVEEERDAQGNLARVRVEGVRYIESDTAWDDRVLRREIGGKKNILVINDEAHHAYRIRPENGDDDDDEEDIEDFYKEATVWVEGLDRINAMRGINFCMDLSATPFFLGRVGQDANRPFPWVVSDFGLIEAIESGLVKIPQLAVRDTTGAAIPGYFNIWEWIVPQLTPAERGGTKGSPKPEAILKYAHTPIAMLGALWEEEQKRWLVERKDDPRPPVFIIVCKNTKIAKVMYEWLADDVRPADIPSANIDGFRNRNGEIVTIRVDSKVVQETDTDSSKSDEVRWMRFTLDTVGRQTWAKDSQGRPIYPDGFAELAEKLKKPLDPPGRYIRCIVSVGMLTEGWDCNTVTHIVGLRPFMSQLLCEQVVGRGLRRANYELVERADGKMVFPEEVAKVFGVQFEVIPFKADPTGAPPPKEKRHHIYAVPGKAQFEITFPRVERYTRAIRNRVTVDWSSVAPLNLVPGTIPPEVDMKAGLPNNQGRPSLVGPGALENITLNPFRKGKRAQQLVFDMAGALTKDYKSRPDCEVPAHVLFPQIKAIVERYLREFVHAHPPADILDVFLAPYYGLVVERLEQAIRPDTSQGEAPEVPMFEQNRPPGSTGEVDRWTSKEPVDVAKSHINAVVPDTMKWEQSAAYYIDNHSLTDAFVKNFGLEFAIPYFHNGQPHDYMPDFIVRLKTDPVIHLILETKGYDPLEQVKAEAAHRWVNAVNADKTFGRWEYRIARKPEGARYVLDDFCKGV
jgi:type III restriction enzyme